MLPSCGTFVEAASQGLPKAAHFLRPVNAQDNENLFSKIKRLVFDGGDGPSQTSRCAASAEQSGVPSGQ
jgi:hypothetical protein